MATTYPAIRPDGSLDPDLFMQGLNQVYGSGSSSSSRSSGGSGSRSSVGSGSRSSGGAAAPAPARTANGGAPASAEVATSSQKASNVMEGFGGQKQWEAIEQHGLTDASQIGVLPEDVKAQTDSLYGGTMDALSKMEDSINRMSEANASLLKGEIPADVSSAVRRAAAESSMAGGVFGSSARNLSARDLGKTSFDIQQTGFANEQAIQSGYDALGKAKESIREYSLNRESTLQELQVKARQVNMSGIDLERSRIATNIDSNLKILDMMTNMIVNQQSIAASAAANDVDPGNIIASIDGWLTKFNEKLA